MPQLKTILRHCVAQPAHENVRVYATAFAEVERQYQLGVSLHPNEAVGIANLMARLASADMAFLLEYVALNFIGFNVTHFQVEEGEMLGFMRSAGSPALPVPVEGAKEF